MELIRIASMEEGVEPLLIRLTRELGDGKNVMWLVPGGSNIPLSVAVMKAIPEELSKHLTIYLTDERFGPIDHPDSNTRLLCEAGIDPKQSRMVGVLAPGLTLDETCEQYALSVETALAAADVVIAQMGMGPDGHICGILPGSQAVESDQLVAGYQTETFTRITLTPKALKQYVSCAYVYAFGDAKKGALSNLLKDMPLTIQPAQILKSLPEAYVYNDSVSGKTAGKVPENT
jgi:6-phosphogluconolactonase/glucosamine-6-phosphate isomerase/deaminase